MNEYSDVLISIREPYSKNAVWIYPGDSIEIRIFLNGWKTIATSEDLGLSNKSIQEINTLLEKLKESILDILNNKTKRCLSDIITLYQKVKNLEDDILSLKKNISKLLKGLIKNGK